MNLGIQYCDKLNMKETKEVGFLQFEILYEQCMENDISEAIGVVLSANGITEEQFLDAIKWVKNYHAKYLLIDTQNVLDDCKLRSIVETHASTIKGAGIHIYIENGYVCKDGKYFCCDFSEAKKLKEIAEEYNVITESDSFAIALNVGYANLLGKNIRIMIEVLGEMLQLLHANDNDGKQNLHQMPYTFAEGRGTWPSTDWYRIIGRLIKSHFDGWIVFDVPGLIASTPDRLQKSMLRLLWSVGKAWFDEFTIEERLNQPEKQLILFGAGQMAKNYLDAWGDAFPPAFLVDNSSKLWGKTRLEYEVKSPQSILEIPEDKRNVWICNQYYDPIGEQLTKMGISYQCYWDHYYL